MDSFKARRFSFTRTGLQGGGWAFDEELVLLVSGLHSGSPPLFSVFPWPPLRRYGSRKRAARSQAGPSLRSLGTIF